MRGGEKIYVYIYYKYRVSCVRFDNWFRLGKKKKKNLTKKKTTIQQYLDTRNTHTVETTTRPLPPLFRFPRGERIILITRSGRRKTKNNPKHEKSRHCRALHPSHNRRSIDIIEGLNPLNPSLRTNTPTIAQVHRRWCAHAAMCVTACRISGPFYNCYDRRGRTTFQRRPDLNATSRTNPDNSPPGAPFTFFSSAILLSLPPLSLSLWSNIYSIKSHRSSVTFFNFISSSLPLFFPHFLYIFHGTLTAGASKRTTARSGICPEFQQLLQPFSRKKRSVLSCFSRGKYHRGRARKSVFPAAKFIGHPSSLILQDLRQIGIGIY